MFQGDENVLYEEWGETLVSKHHPVVCVLDIRSQTIRVLEGVPDEVSAGHVSQYANEDQLATKSELSKNLIVLLVKKMTFSLKLMPLRRVETSTPIISPCLLHNMLLFTIVHNFIHHTHMYIL